MMANREKEVWDYEWDYKNGDIDENKFILFPGSQEWTKTSEGILLSQLSNPNWYVCYNFYKNASKIINETVVLFKEFSTRQGFRIVLGNGMYGAQVYAVTGKLYLNIDDAYLDSNGWYIADLEKERDYTIRVEFDDITGIAVYLDGEKKVDKEVFSRYYATNTAFVQHYGGASVLKSIKYKFND